MVPDSTDKTPPNLRLLRILEVMAAHGGPLSIADLHRHLQWPKPSLHRLCSLLLEEGYLEKHAQLLALSRRVSTLATGILSALPTNQAHHQVLLALSEKTGETVNFVMPRQRGMGYVDRAETNWLLRIQLPIGTLVPFHCTASGKTYMASLRAQTRRTFVRHLHLKAHTPNTITDRNALLGALKEIKRRGYALDNGEFYDNMYAIAVPVQDPKGNFHAALAIHGPRQRFTPDIALTWVDSLHQSARAIARITFGTE